jgi:STE24 endopeptidase
VFAKSQDYGRHKAKFSLFSNIYRLPFDILMVAYFYPWAWRVSGSALVKVGYGPEYQVRAASVCLPTRAKDIFVRQITQSVVFVMLLTLTSMIPSIPLGIYQTFVLEAKHGFNKTTPGLYVADLAKSLLLGLVLGAPLLSAFLYIFEWAGDRFLPYLMALLYVLRPAHRAQHSTCRL